ncbi:MAG: threonylcarbamoyl-AMP synthase [Spartobacteria bacterium]|nr:threonylcarbamoyl-AMP synthase [Spartobacteria bacterium]
MSKKPDIFKIFSKNDLKMGAKRAVEVILDGKLVIFPTETVYGVACNADDPEAMERLFLAKNREKNKPVAYFVENFAKIYDFGAKIGIFGEKLAKKYWPGPLTLVLEAQNGFLGFRCPDHPVPQAILAALPCHLAVTSANLSGKPEACTAADAMADIGDYVELVLDAGRVTGTLPSTVVKVDGEACTILREGAISRNEIAKL